MAINKDASRIWIAKLRNVLNQIWDPIGVAHSIDDEYDTYLGQITTLMRENATDDALMQYLERMESVQMGLGRFDKERARRVIAALRQLGPNS